MLVLPAQSLLVLLLFLPALYVFWLSLNRSTYGTRPVWVGFANYATVLADPYFWTATLNTAIVVNAVVLLEFLLALAIAMLFSGWIPWRRLMIAIVLAPYAISEVVSVVIWKFMMEPYAGPVTLALQSVGLPVLDWAVEPAHGLAMVILLSVWHHLPFTFILLYTALLGIPRDLYEAAKVDGAGAWRRFVDVTMPLLVPAMLVAVVFRYIFAFRIFSEVWLLTGGGPARTTEVLAVYLYRQAFRYADFGAAAATGWLMLLGSLLMGAWYIQQMYKRMFVGGRA
ncbi:MAG: sugar ABC transporter permease [Rhodoferax sp.]|nr:sugar ABC transporter permease [Rhodoferax sp.]